ncbi:MAG: YbbR-like domain-containing protein [Planctomycetota bacterium]|jgi:hypothetical protein
MARKIKYGKAAIVVFLTALIWIWADLAQDETFMIPHATITIARSVDPSLQVTFGESSSFTIDDIVVKGPASKIADLEREHIAGTLNLTFFLDPVRMDMFTTPGKHLLELQSFVRNSRLIRDRGLTVESCSPRSITVMVDKLEEKSLKVRCIDEDGAIIKDATIDPTHVAMFVPGGWEGDRVTAFVPLSPAEIEQARLGAISGRAQVELAPGQIRRANTTVRIKMPPGGPADLTERTVTAANLAIALSVTLLGDYDVEVTNRTDVVRPFTIKATDEAMYAYQNQPFQMTLYIFDGDEKIEGEQPRDVVYNLPEQFVRNGQIMPPLLRVEARFKLIPLASGEGPPTGGP